MDTVHLADTSARESCRLGELRLWREKFNVEAMDEERMRIQMSLDYGDTPFMQWPQVQTRPIITSDRSPGLVDFDDMITQRHLLDEIEKRIGLEAFGFKGWVSIAFWQ